MPFGHGQATDPSLPPTFPQQGHNKLSSPAALETITMGTKYTIRWDNLTTTTPNDSSNAHNLIYLFLEDATPILNNLSDVINMKRVLQIAAVENTGSYEWDVPVVGIQEGREYVVEGQVDLVPERWSYSERFRIAHWDGSGMVLGGDGKGGCASGGLERKDLVLIGVFGGIGVFLLGLLAGWVVVREWRKREARRVALKEKE